MTKPLTVKDLPWQGHYRPRPKLSVQPGGGFLIEYTELGETYRVTPQPYPERDAARRADAAKLKEWFSHSPYYADAAKRAEEETGDPLAFYISWMDSCPNIVDANRTEQFPSNSIVEKLPSTKPSE